MCKFVIQIQTLAQKHFHLNLHSLKQIWLSVCVLHKCSVRNKKNVEELKLELKEVRYLHHCVAERVQNRLILGGPASACLSLFGHSHFTRTLHCYVDLQLPSVPALPR